MFPSSHIHCLLYLEKHTLNLFSYGTFVISKNHISQEVDHFGLVGMSLDKAKKGKRLLIEDAR